MKSQRPACTVTSPTPVTIHSVFDSQGRRIVEYNEATGALIREYIWHCWGEADQETLRWSVFPPNARARLRGPGVAVIEGGVVSFVRTDHIGRPIFATNAAGVKVWTATYTPFGEVVTSTGVAPSARFPGQWFQTESGLHQNWMRDYDPTTGRYLEADPLRLVDGASVYGYALQSPIVHIDPRGEDVAGIWKSPIGRKALGAAAGASIGDGPLPFGEALGLCILGAATAYCALDGYYCTADDGGTDCEQEWEDAYDWCELELSKPNPSRGLTGGYKTLYECAKGHVSERCGGNKVEY